MLLIAYLEYTNTLFKVQPWIKSGVGQQIAMILISYFLFYFSLLPSHTSPQQRQSFLQVFLFWKGLAFNYIFFQIEVKWEHGMFYQRETRNILVNLREHKILTLPPSKNKLENNTIQKRH